jgi:parallel beta-helix repeat protein
MNRRKFLTWLGLSWLASVSPTFIASSLVNAQNNLKSKQIVFYVAPNGNDSWTGIKPTRQGKNGPFATIAKAQQAIRQLKQKQGGSLKQPVAVWIRGGSYFLKQPLQFTPDDSGTKDFPVSYQAYRQEKPVISGGKIIQGWKIAKLKGKTVWTTTIPEVKAGKWLFHQLWVNGDRRQRCRYPKQGYLKVDRATESPAEWRQGQNSFHFRPGDLKAWDNADRGEAIVLTRWVESRLPIEAIDEKSNIISFRNHSTYRIDPGDSSSSAAGVYYLENVLAFLTDPGEWYLDSQSGQLYYLPLPGEKPDRFSVIAPVLSTIVDLKGDWQQKKFVENLSFENLTFAHTEWYFDSDYQATEGISENSRGFAQAAYKVPGAIKAIATHQCIWKQCTIAHIGNYGIEFADDSIDNQILKCHLYDLGAGGVKINNYGWNRIDSCHIHHGGKIFPSAVAIWIGDAYDNLLTGNHIHDFYYTAISVGWNWGYDSNAAAGNLIEFNHIHHLGKLSNGDGPLLNDKGGIYTLGVQPQTTIRSNLIHDIDAYNYGGWGIYLDEGSSQITVEKNLVYNTRDGGFHLHYGRNNIIRNNIFAFGRLAQIQRSGTDSPEFSSFTLENNIIYWHEGKLLAGKWEDFGYIFDRNLYWRVGDAQIDFDRLSWQQWQQQGMDLNSQIADPLFIEPQRGDFRLKPNSPALGIGFQPINKLVNM